MSRYARKRKMLDLNMTSRGWRKNQALLSGRQQYHSRKQNTHSELQFQLQYRTYFSNTPYESRHSKFAGTLKRWLAHLKQHYKRVSHSDLAKRQSMEWKHLVQVFMKEDKSLFIDDTQHPFVDLSFLIAFVQFESICSLATFNPFLLEEDADRYSHPPPLEYHPQIQATCAPNV